MRAMTTTTTDTYNGITKIFVETFDADFKWYL